MIRQCIPSLVVYKVERPSLAHFEVQHTLNLLFVMFINLVFSIITPRACSYLDQTWFYYVYSVYCEYTCFNEKRNRARKRKREKWEMINQKQAVVRLKD